MTNFGPKPQTIPFGGISIFRLFELLFFLQPKITFFSFYSIINTFYWSILPKIKKMEKWPILDQNHGLSLLDKSQFFDSLNFLFLQPRMAFFCCTLSVNTFSWIIFPKMSAISENTFSWIILPKRKKMKKWPIWDQNHGLSLS